VFFAITGAGLVAGLATVACTAEAAAGLAIIACDCACVAALPAQANASSAPMILQRRETFEERIHAFMI
jgi:hypothetical protein